MALLHTSGAFCQAGRALSLSAGVLFGPVVYCWDSPSLLRPASTVRAIVSGSEALRSSRDALSADNPPVSLQINTGFF